MNQRHFFTASTWLLCATVVLGLAWPDDSQAARRHKGGTKFGRVHSDNGSAETAKERERRLLRECKGRNNAGACEGFTR